MKIRKYLAGDISEGLQRIKKELGPDAIILQTRPVRRKGLRGYFTPRQLEIIAALDTNREEKAGLGEALTQVLVEDKRTEKMKEELLELKSMVSRLTESSPPRTDFPFPADGAVIKKPIMYWRRYLEHQDLDAVLLHELLSEIEKETAGPGRVSQTVVAQLLQTKTVRRLRCDATKKYRTQIFVGPTGVGKTTTLAKLAARFALDEQERVGLLTIDHYRIGAVDQLRTYAEIMDLPLEVVYSPRDLVKAMLRLEGCERILVDTAGRATGNTEQMEELSGYIELLQPADIYLVISATTRQQDIRLITECFNRLKYNRLIVTKLDEAAVYGAVLNSIYYTNLPLAYLTNGQRVPEDLKLVNEAELAGLLWGVS
ncbi:MAG: flagellar biosynthesis protein FlhF [Bacillota bacterium]